MTSERNPAEAREERDADIPPLHFGPLRRWLESHPERAPQLFGKKTFPRETLIFPSQGLSGHETPRLLIVLEGELSLIQLFPGSMAPYRSLYRRDFWVNPNPSSAKRRAHRAAIRIESVAASRVLLLTERGLRSLPGTEVGELEGILDDYADLQRSRRTFFNALRNTVQFQQAGVRHLHSLLDTADVFSFESSRNSDPVVVPQGSTQEQHKGVFLVLNGQLGEWREAQDAESQPVLTRALYPGSLFGDVVMHSDAPAPCTVKIHSDTARVAFLPERSSERLIRRSPLFASAVAPSPAEVWHRLAEGLTRLAAAPEVVLFRTDASDVPLDVLLQHVADATHQSYRDRILRVEVSTSSPTSPPAFLPEFRLGHVPTHRLVAPNGPAAAQKLQQLAQELRGRWDYFFVQVEPSLWPGLAPPADSAAGFRPLLDGEVTWKLVYLSRDPLSAEPPLGFDRGSILYTALLEPGTERKPGPAFPAGTTRLPLNLRHFSSHRLFSSRASSEQELFRRWGRAITERTVGIALGAGGSWGYAEIAVIRGMLERKIPIDVLSGTSFGAVAGAFFSSLGLDGLELLLKEGHTFLGVVAASMVNSSAISFAFDRILGRRRLEKSEIPFFPVGTDVSLSQAWVLQRGTLGAGIRSSGIMPGILSPAWTDTDGRVVDGAFINSVPASVLVSQRANLVVATNVLSDPPDEKDSGPLLPGPLGWFLHGLNPVGRLGDLVRSTLILFHSGGELNAYGADVVFNLPFTPIPPWAFGRGQAFVDKAASVMGPTLDEIEARWKAMSLPREDLISRALSAGASLLPKGVGTLFRKWGPA